MEEKIKRGIPKKIEPQVKRVYKGDHEIIADTYKLSVEYYLRNISFNPKRPIKEPVEHCHFYHTFDSFGRANIKSNSVGGHYHTIEVKLLENGELTGICSAPIMNKGSDPLHPDDRHVHDVKYLKSEKFKARKTNDQAIKAYSGYMDNFKLQGE